MNFPIPPDLYSRTCGILDDGYKGWPVVAGFFDGDGNVEEKLGQFTINVKIGFTDNWDRQLIAVGNFLSLKGIRAGGLTKKKFEHRLSAWQIRIPNLDGVLLASKEMLPYVYKKRAELQAIVDYLEDRTTGDELVRCVNHEVEIGNKVGILKTAKIPYTRSEGLRLKVALNLEKAHAATRICVTEEEQSMIRYRYNTDRVPIVKLAIDFGYGRLVIERVLGARQK